MLIHLVSGATVVGLTVVAGVAFFLGQPRRALDGIAGWALGLLIVQVASGVFLLTSGDEGPGLPHVILPIGAVVVAGVARSAKPGTGLGPDPLRGAAFSLAAVAALVALLTGLTAG